VTRKDYEAVATVLNEAWDRMMDAHNPIDIFHATVNDFCDMFAADNPNFDPNRFREAVYA